MDYPLEVWLRGVSVHLVRKPSLLLVPQWPGWVGGSGDGCGRQLPGQVLVGYTVTMKPVVL